MTSRLRAGCEDVRMAAPGKTHRSEVRSAMVTFRCSPAERAAIRHRAHAAGVSMQAYLERIVLERPDAQDRPPGPTSDPEQQELPMTG